MQVVVFGVEHRRHNYSIWGTYFDSERQVVGIDFFRNDRFSEGHVRKLVKMRYLRQTDLGFAISDLDSVEINARVVKNT